MSVKKPVLTVRIKQELINTAFAPIFQSKRGVGATGNKPPQQSADFGKIAAVRARPMIWRPHG